MPYDDTEKILRIAEHVDSIMGLLNIETTESNKETPRRIAKMLVNELFYSINDKDIATKLDERMTVFPVEGGLDKPIVVETPFYSMCEHHWLPFYGTAKITYVPKHRIIGLSKIPRVVAYFSHRPQLQERLTKDIGEYLVTLLEPLSLSVEIEAEHMCVSMRGATAPCKTKTFWDWGEKKSETCKETCTVNT